MAEPLKPLPLWLGAESRFIEALEFAGRFHMGESTVHMALAKLARNLDATHISYAVVGAMAMNLHGFHRVTVDIDVLVTPEGFARFNEVWVGRGYAERSVGARRVRDTEHDVPIDFLLSGDFPGDRKPKPVCFPDPATKAVILGGVAVLPLELIIEMKLASGMSAPHRLKDLADVIELIRTLDLDEALATRLAPSVQDKYRELWRAARSAGPDDPR